VRESLLEGNSFCPTQQLTLIAMVFDLILDFQPNPSRSEVKGEF
jgi:hypothetical protein